MAEEKKRIIFSFGPYEDTKNAVKKGFWLTFWLILAVIALVIYFIYLVVVTIIAFLTWFWEIFICEVIWNTIIRDWIWNTFVCTWVWKTLICEWIFDTMLHTWLWDTVICMWAWFLLKIFVFPIIWPVFLFLKYQNEINNWLNQFLFLDSVVFIVLLGVIAIVIYYFIFISFGKLSKYLVKKYHIPTIFILLINYVFCAPFMLSVYFNLLATPIEKIWFGKTHAEAIKNIFMLEWGLQKPEEFIKEGNSI